MGENPDEALEFVWELLDDRFGSHPKPAKDLMKELEEFPSIYPDNRDQLWRFAQACKQANKLMETDRGLELKVLNYPAAQLKVTKRLPSGLFEKWKHHAYKYKIEWDKSIPFQKFCGWIMMQVKESSNPDFDEDVPAYSKDVTKPTGGYRGNSGRYPPTTQRNVPLVRMPCEYYAHVFGKEQK